MLTVHIDGDFLDGKAEPSDSQPIKPGCDGEKCEPSRTVAPGSSHAWDKRQLSAYHGPSAISLSMHVTDDARSLAGRVPARDREEQGEKQESRRYSPLNRATARSSIAELNGMN
jgi:hypothetical protein